MRSGNNSPKDTLGLRKTITKRNTKRKNFIYHDPNQSTHHRGLVYRKHVLGPFSGDLMTFNIHQLALGQKNTNGQIAQKNPNDVPAQKNSNAVPNQEIARKNPSAVPKQETRQKKPLTWEETYIRMYSEYVMDIRYCKGDFRDMRKGPLFFQNPLARNVPQTQNQNSQSRQDPSMVQQSNRLYK